jgi:tyrosine-protein kinase Etk/Wzc
MSTEKQKEVNILDVLIALAKHKMFIIKMVFTITLIALIISLVWPQSYKSTTTFIPSTPQRGLPAGIAGMLGGSLSLPMDFPRVNTEVYLNILRSRELREAVITEFNFDEIYRTDLMEELLLKLNDDIDISENREGGFGFNPIFSIELSFTSREPELSRDVVQFMLDRLNRKVQEINLENASEHLHLLEERYQQNLADLEKAEVALQSFQEEYGILEVEEQAKQLVQKLGQLKASSIEAEMRMAVLSQTVGPENVELINLRRMKEEYDRQYRNLLQQSDGESVRAEAFHPLLDMPELGIQYFRLFREVQIQAKIMESIYPQLESQRMIVRANQRGIQVIDPPVVPTYKDGPKRAFIVLGGMFFSIFLALTIVFFREMLEQGRAANSESYRKLNELWAHLKIQSRKKADNTAG